MTTRYTFRYDPQPQKPKKTKHGIRLVREEKGRRRRRAPRNFLADIIEEGADWWAGHSAKSVEAIQRLFDKAEVAGLLYERIGAIVPDGPPTENGKYPIKIQIVAGEEFTDLCLSEIGIVIDELIEP